MEAACNASHVQDIKGSCNYNFNPAYTPNRINVPLPDIPNNTTGHEPMYEEVGYEQIQEMGKDDNATFCADYLYMEQDYN